jgi:hypothetical protein
VSRNALCGAHDDIVPLEISRRYFVAAKKSGDDSKLTEVAGRRTLRADRSAIERMAGGQTGGS